MASATEHQVVKATAAVSIKTDDLAVEYDAMRGNRERDCSATVRPTLETSGPSVRQAGSEDR